MQKQRDVSREPFVGEISVPEGAHPGEEMKTRKKRGQRKSLTVSQRCIDYNRAAGVSLWSWGCRERKACFSWRQCRLCGQQARRQPGASLLVWRVMPLNVVSRGTCESNCQIKTIANKYHPCILRSIFFNRSLKLIIQLWTCLNSKWCYCSKHFKDTMGTKRNTSAENAQLMGSQVIIMKQAPVAGAVKRLQCRRRAELCPSWQWGTVSGPRPVTSAELMLGGPAVGGRGETCHVANHSLWDYDETGEEPVFRFMWESLRLFFSAKVEYNHA